MKEQKYTKSYEKTNQYTNANTNSFEKKSPFLLKHQRISPFWIFMSDVFTVLLDPQVRVGTLDYLEEKKIKKKWILKW